MAKAVKKTISLPFELAREVEEIAREERKTLSAVIQEALKISRKEKLKKGVLPNSELLEFQGEGERHSYRKRS